MLVFCMETVNCLLIAALLDRYASCILAWDIMNCADMYIQTRIFRFLFDQVWVVNSEPQPDTWVVNLNSWVVNEPLSAYKT